MREQNGQELPADGEANPRMTSCLLRPRKNKPVNRKSEDGKFGARRAMPIGNRRPEADFLSLYFSVQFFSVLIHPCYFRVQSVAHYLE